MIKVEHRDLEKLVRYLDKVSKHPEINKTSIILASKRLSSMIKDKYIDIKPHYDSTNRC